MYEGFEELRENMAYRLILEDGLTVYASYDGNVNSELFGSLERFVFRESSKNGREVIGGREIQEKDMMRGQDVVFIDSGAKVIKDRYLKLNGPGGHLFIKYDKKLKALGL